jgi:hypothetical protein
LESKYAVFLDDSSLKLEAAALALENYYIRAIDDPHLSEAIMEINEIARKAKALKREIRRFMSKSLSRRKVFILGGKRGAPASAFYSEIAISLQGLAIWADKLTAMGTAYPTSAEAAKIEGELRFCLLGLAKRAEAVAQTICFRLSGRRAIFADDVGDYIRMRGARENG